MKKRIFVTLFVLVTVAGIVFAASHAVICNSTRSGKCNHGACSCKHYVSAHNGGKCICGHWDYVHDR